MIGSTILELGRVDSTNGYANRLLSEGEPADGTVIWAHEQYAGRGQQKNHWISKKGKNLTFTVILKPVFLAPDRQFLLNKAISLGVVDFIRSLQDHIPGPRIKWPNDIYIGNQKVGGILIEHKIMGSSLETTLAGIGININQTKFPVDIPNPVSLIQILGFEISLKAALDSVCRFLDLRYSEIPERDAGNLDQDYKHALLGFNEWRWFTLNGSIMEGKINGVDDLGRLQVETRNGTMLQFNHGEIAYSLV